MLRIVYDRSSVWPVIRLCLQTNRDYRVNALLATKDRFAEFANILRTSFFEIAGGRNAEPRHDMPG